MIVNKKIRSFFAFIFAFILIFDLKVIGSIGSSVFVIILYIILLIINPHRYFKNLSLVFGVYKYFLILYLILLIYVFLRVILDQAGDISYVLTTLKTSMILIASFLYLAIFIDQNLIKIIIKVFILNSLICLLFGTYSEYKFIIQIFQYPVNATNELIGFNEYRNAFLAGSGYFGISSLYALVCPIYLFYLLNEKNLFNYFLFIIVLVVGVLAGRVALLCYFITFVYYFIVTKKFNLIYIFLLFCGLGFFALNFIPAFDNAQKWFYELYFNDGGYSNSSTISELLDMYYLPDGSNLIYGYGQYTNSFGGYFGGSDVGYIRNIFFGGLLYQALIFLVFFSLFMKSYDSYLAYILILLSLLLHFKGVFILNNPGFFPLLILTIFELNKKKLNFYRSNFTL